MTVPMIVTRPSSQGEGGPGRVTTIADRRVEMTVPLCLELVDAVRCMDPRRTHDLLELIDQPAALVVLAAMVDQDRPASYLLRWLENAPRPIPVLPRLHVLPGITDQARQAHNEFNRRKNNGQPIDPQLRAGETEYQRLRAVQRRARAKAAQ